MESRERARGLEFGKPGTIGEDVWNGGSAVICPGGTIGDRSVIGAGSVVTKDIPPDVFAAGNPCRVIRGLTRED
jgi:maltose O-acetyltransferase